MTVEQKAKRFCKDFVFTYIIPSYNQTKRKSGALIAEESFIAGYNECEKEHEWHYPSKGEYPECDENKKLWLYFNDYYANDRDCEHPFKRLSIGVYKESFLNNKVKLFAEKVKGYESEILPKDIIAWKEIIPPKEIE